MAKFWLRFSCTDMGANDWLTVKRLVPEECLEYAGNKIDDMKKEVMAYIEASSASPQARAGK